MLSGGERSRVRLATLLASAKNLIVLDEPTNHLDIESSERLEDALRPDTGFEGTIILISHDRAMIDAVCDHLIVLDAEGNVEIFDGNWTAWHSREQSRAADHAAREQAEKDARARDEKRRRANEAKRAKKTVKPAKPAERPAGNPLSSLSIGKIEERIERVQTRIREIDEQLASPDVWSNPKKCDTLGKERTALAQELEPLEFEWLARADDA